MVCVLALDSNNQKLLSFCFRAAIQEVHVFFLFGYRENLDSELEYSSIFFGVFPMFFSMQSAQESVSSIRAWPRGKKCSCSPRSNKMQTTATQWTKNGANGKRGARNGIRTRPKKQNIFFCLSHSPTLIRIQFQKSSQMRVHSQCMNSLMQCQVFVFFFSTKPKWRKERISKCSLCINCVNENCHRPRKKFALNLMIFPHPSIPFSLPSGLDSFNTFTGSTCPSVGS